MKTYPIMLDVRGLLAVVVGGGSVGMRKVASLLEAGARVRLVSKDAPVGGAPPGVELHQVPYRPELLAGAKLVFACTDDARLNAAIAADARRAGALVNAADQPEGCDFYLPSVIAQGDVVVAIGTGGSAPALAARLRDRLAAALPERTGEFAALLGELREHLKGRIGDAGRRMAIMKALSGEETYREFLQQGPRAVRRRLARHLSDDRETG